MSTNNKDSLLPLNPMQLPEVPSWFPLAWGWWATAGAIVFGALIIWLTYRWNKKRLAPKKTALKLIQAGDKPAEAIELLRQAALCYYPREEVAQLTGKEWYAFLDTQVKSPVFVNNYELWQEALYSKQPVGNAAELITHCAQWVDEALPQKEGEPKLANIEFVWWWAFLLLPLPILIYFLLPPVKQSSPVYMPYLPDSAVGSAPRNLLAKVLASLVWLGVITAVARPVWYGDPVTTQPKHRDMMLVVDLSYSMSKEDMQFNGDYIDRLSAVKHVLSDFISKRQGDRLGLVLFADHAYLQTPLTLDRQTVAEQLNQTVLRLVGTKTAIGEGIGLATKTFVDSDAPQRVMILLSDGSNTAGVLDPIEAAEIAKKYNATIYTVGVGAGEMMVKEFFMTRKVNTAQDLDEKSLMSIAQLTGGQYFRARDSKELATIYDTINSLEPVSQATQTWRPQQEWFGVPLAIALTGLFVLIIIRRNHV